MNIENKHLIFGVFFGGMLSDNDIPEVHFMAYYVEMEFVISNFFILCHITNVLIYYAVDMVPLI